MAKSALSNAGPDSRPGREKCLDVDAGSPASLQAAGARQCALNQSEEELLACLGEGLLYKEIEERLHLSHTALRKRQHRLYAKLDAQNRTEALNQWWEMCQACKIRTGGAACGGGYGVTGPQGSVSISIIRAKTAGPFGALGRAIGP
jgi:DNA-binding CsgD family transcriptional regulator